MIMSRIVSRNRLRLGNPGLHGEREHQRRLRQKTDLIVIPGARRVVLDTEHALHLTIEQNRRVHQRAHLAPARLGRESTGQRRIRGVGYGDRLALGADGEITIVRSAGKLRADPIAIEAIVASIEKGLTAQRRRLGRAAPETGRSYSKCFRGRAQHTDKRL